MPTARRLGAPAAPFTGGGLVVETPGSAPASTMVSPPRLSSPFAEAFTGAGEADEEALATEALLAELEDDEFDEAVDALVDEVAARHLGSTPSWSSEAGSADVAASEAEAWAATVASRADRFLEHLDRELAGRPLDALGGRRDRRRERPDHRRRRPRRCHRAAVRRAGQEGLRGGQGHRQDRHQGGEGDRQSGGHPRLLRRLVPWLIRRVVDKAINRLPHGLRPASRASWPAASAPARPRRPKQTSPRSSTTGSPTALLAPDDLAADQILAEAEAGAAPGRRRTARDTRRGSCPARDPARGGRARRAAGGRDRAVHPGRDGRDAPPCARSPPWSGGTSSAARGQPHRPA